MASWCSFRNSVASIVDLVDAMARLQVDRSRHHSPQRLLLFSPDDSSDDPASKGRFHAPSIYMYRRALQLVQLVLVARCRFSEMGRAATQLGMVGRCRSEIASSRSTLHVFCAAMPGAMGEGKAGESYRYESRKKDVRWDNLEAAKAVADAVRTSLGPRGMDKMVRRIVLWNRARAQDRTVEAQERKKRAEGCTRGARDASRRRTDGRSDVFSRRWNKPTAKC